MKPLSLIVYITLLLILHSITSLPSTHNYTRKRIEVQNELQNMNNIYLKLQQKVLLDIKEGKEVIIKISEIKNILRFLNDLQYKQQEKVKKLKSQINNNKKAIHVEQKKTQTNQMLKSTWESIQSTERSEEGWNAQYYDNEYFNGKSKELSFRDINWVWIDSSVVNKVNFSLRFFGFLTLPLTTKYFFRIETNGKARWIINNDIVIDTFPDSRDKSFDSKDIFLPSELNAKIELMFYFSVHDFLNIEDIESKIFWKLYWKYSSTGYEIIPSTDLHKYKPIPPLEVTISSIKTQSGVSEEIVYTHSYWREKEWCFAYNNNYIVDKIPKDFFNANMLKLPFIPPYDNPDSSSYSLLLKVNNPITIYIGISDKLHANPFDKEFEDNGSSWTVVDIYLQNTNKQRKKLNPLSIWNYKIYQRSFDNQGVIQWDFTFKTNMILFYKYNPRLSLNERWICKDRKYIPVVSCSTWNNVNEISRNNYSCLDGTNGKLIDDKTGMFLLSSATEEFLEITFDGVYEIHTVEIKLRNNPYQRIKTMEIRYHGYNENVKYELDNTGNIQWYNVNLIRTQKLVVTVKEVYHSNNFDLFDIGYAIRFNGKHCSEDDLASAHSILSKYSLSLNNTNLIPVFAQSPKQPIKLNCKDSITNSHWFTFETLREGNVILVECPEYCISDESTNLPWYGGMQNLYSKDSSICLSYQHSEWYTKWSSIFYISLRGELGHLNGISRNNILSKYKEYTPLSFTFEEYVKESFESAYISKQPEVFTVSFNTTQSVGRFGDLNNNFGFNRNVEKIMLGSGASFGHSPYSIYCTKEYRKTICDDIVWLVFVGKGKFKIDIFVYDDNEVTYENLQINDIKVCENTIIPKGERKEFSIVVKDYKGFIIVTAYCDYEKNNCDYAQTKINGITITKIRS